MHTKEIIKNVTGIDTSKERLSKLERKVLEEILKKLDGVK